MFQHDVSKDKRLKVTRSLWIDYITLAVQRVAWLENVEHQSDKFIIDDLAIEVDVELGEKVKEVVLGQMNVLLAKHLSQLKFRNVSSPVDVHLTKPA